MIKLGIDETLPTGWKWVSAQDVIDVRDGTHDSPKYIAKGIPLVTSKNLDNGKINFDSCQFITQEDHDGISKRSKVDDGDILYAMIGTVGNPVIVEKKTDFSIKNVALFKFDGKNIYNRFFYHFLNDSLVKIQFEKNKRGGTQKFISLGNLRKLQIPLPPLPEQKRIAAILDKADAIRRKRQQAIDLADQYLRSVFLDMFSDLFSTNGYVKSNKKPIKELVSIIDYRGKTPQKTDTGVTLITAKNVKKGFISKTPAEFISEDLYKSWMTRGYPLEGDVLFTTEAPLGNVAILGSYEKVCIGQRLISLRTKEALTPEYLLFALLSPLMRNLIAKRSTGSTVKGIRSKEFVQIQVPIPDIKLQKKFSEIYSKLSLNKTKQNKYLGNNESLFNALSQQAFAGKL